MTAAAVLQPRARAEEGRTGGKGREREEALRQALSDWECLLGAHESSRTLRRMRSPPLPGGRLGIGGVLIWDSSPGFLAESPTFLFSLSANLQALGSQEKQPLQRGGALVRTSEPKRKPCLRGGTRGSLSRHTARGRRGSGKTLRGQTTGQVVLPQGPELKALDPPGSGPPGERSLGSIIGGPPRVPDTPHPAVSPRQRVPLERQTQNKQ